MRPDPTPRPQRPTPAVLCLGHLGWNWVWQRPQQILSRVARHWPVIYVNEPGIQRGYLAEPYLDLVAEQANLSAWQPEFPDRAELLPRWRETYVELVRDRLLRRGWLARSDGVIRATRPLLLWFYTPVPFYFADQMPAEVIVYDVMDELASFKHAAPDMAEREARLLARADVVFAGGRSLFEARRGRHGNLHLFASGVEPEHFAAALSPETEIPAEIAGLPHPVLGYYGVIDERLDYALLREVAERRPDWSIVMVGPRSVKVEASALPRLPNLYYTGQQPYQRLPGFLKGFDVCLMPFAMSVATRSISPTKTLEYMAAHKPIVSTPVPDVAANWGDVVAIASSAEEVISAVERLLGETEPERARRWAREAAIVADNTWDRIAEAIRARIEETLSVVRSTT
jgi:UDP-galactopyranose mutase